MHTLSDQLLLLLSLIVIYTSTATPCTNNHIYLPHGYAVVSKSDAFVQQEARAYRELSFRTQLVNLAAFDSNGNMPSRQYSQLASWVSKMNAADPSARVVAYVNGHKKTHVDGGVQVHRNIARVCGELVESHQCHGIHLDFEPMDADDDNFFRLVTQVRATIGNAHLSIAAPANKNWSKQFIAKLASIPVDVFMPMGYDSSLATVQEYADYIHVAASHYKHALVNQKGGQLSITLPAYATNPWHNPAVENIASGARGLLAAHVQAAGVWHWHEMSAADKQSWKAHWLQACTRASDGALSTLPPSPVPSPPSLPPSAASSSKSPSCAISGGGELLVSGLAPGAGCVMRTDTYKEFATSHGCANLGDAKPGTRIEVYTTLNGPYDCSGYLYDLGCETSLIELKSLSLQQDDDEWVE